MEFPCLTRFDQLLFKILQFFQRAGNGAIGIGHVPVHSFRTIILAGIGYLHPYGNGSVLTYGRSRCTWSAIFECRIAQSVSERVERIAGNVLIEALMSRALPLRL